MKANVKSSELFTILNEEQIFVLLTSSKFGTFVFQLSIFEVMHELERKGIKNVIVDIRENDKTYSCVFLD